MHYLSTRGAKEPHAFADVLLGGLAADGGLFMPAFWPHIGEMEIAGYRDAAYQDVAFRILERFVGSAFSTADLKADISAAYTPFDRPEIAPLAELKSNLYLLELFHGPTLAFKDIAMQLLGRMFSRILGVERRQATVVVATSGDTGSSAVAALGGLPNIELFVLYPHGRVSTIQRLQMTTAPFANVHNVALEGTFDDAQAIVKRLFADRDFAARTRLVAVNSINFARIVAQSVYYFTAAAKLPQPAVFVVPTGNFGDVFAGEAAMRMGLGLNRLVVATNANDIMAHALNEGLYAAGHARATLSPSMDIQVASNFERALFEASGRDSGWVARAMRDFSRDQRIELPRHIQTALKAHYGAASADDEATLGAMAEVYRDSGRFIDPHTAVGVSVAARLREPHDRPVVVLATAHPAKFTDAVVRATGKAPPLPQRLAALYEKPERYAVLANSDAAIRAHIETRLNVP